MSQKDLPHFTIKQLLEAGVHFGHKSMRRNPKMSKYVYQTRNGISIIDLNKTASCLYKAMILVNEVAKNNGRILFVATKKQASAIVAEAAKRCGQYYVNYRWLGGMLTNWKTVSQSIKTLKKIEEQLAGSEEEVDFKKKEKLVLERKRLKLEQALGGIKNMGGYPDLVFVIDTINEELAILEAKKLGVPIVAIVDSNSNPDGIAYPIPGNDDSAKAIKIYCNLIADAIISGIRENMAASGVDLSKVAENALPEKIHDAEKKSAKYHDKKRVIHVASEDKKDRDHKVVVKSESVKAEKDSHETEEKKVVKEKTEKKSPVKTAAKKPVAEKKTTKK